MKRFCVISNVLLAAISLYFAVAYAEMVAKYNKQMQDQIDFNNMILTILREKGYVVEQRETDGFEF